ncbi:hypothetical protein ACET3Z_030597 [Daucus carota]
MDAFLMQQCTKMEERSSTKPKELEQVHNTLTNGRCTPPGQMDNVTAEDVQKASAGTKVGVNVSVGDKIVPSADDSIKLLPFGELPQDMKMCSPGPVEVQAENQSKISPNSIKVTPDHNHKFGSEMVNNEAEENHVIATENTENGPIKGQNSEFGHINMEQKGTLPEEVTPNNCLESSIPQIDTQSRIYSSDLLGSPTGDAANDHIHLEQQINNAPNSSGLEQLGPGQETAAEGSSHLEETVEGTPVLPRNRPISMISSEGNIKVLSGKRKKNQNLLVSSSRTLRSRSQEKSKAPDTSNMVTEGADSQKKKKRKKRMEKNKIDEYSRIRTHLRYLLHRIQYEKNFIDAYSGEGWKGQSLEKLKPEKELQRARSEIVRRKLKIRDLFQRLDLLCSEGRIPDNLFDSEGEIDSEDIFCAKCGSKDVTLSNDIILCDGACERGFHQFCLDPPLLRERIPAGDEGWLCPGCDCKVDCLELLNDSQGTKILVTDSWEKVFAEEAAAAAAGKNLDDISGLPSDDSEDDDYNPDSPDLDENVQADVSSSDESDNHSGADDLRVLPQKELFLGLPSDDSEDDDYDPSSLNNDQKSKMESSSSDFTSDSEDLTVVVDKCKPSSEVQGPVTSSPDDVMEDEEGCGLPEEGDCASVYPRRQVKRLDYKKLHDEEYGNTSSDSSDEDYMDLALPNTKKNISEEEDLLSPNLEVTTENGKESDDSEPDQKTNENTHNKRSSKTKFTVSGTNSTPARSCKGSPTTGGKSTSRLQKKVDVNGAYSTPARSCKDFAATSDKSTSSLKKKFDVDVTNSTPARSPKCSSATTRKGTPRSSFGEQATQRLLQSFKENQYPQRTVKESLATELQLTIQQVSKWFENARHSFRHSRGRASDVAKIAPDKVTPQKSSNLSESDSRSVLNNTTCSEVKKKKQDEGTTAECCDKDTTSNMVAEEGNGCNSSSTNPRKRKAKFGSEATEPNTSSETLEQNAEVNPQKTSKRKTKFGSEATELDTSSETPEQNAEVDPQKTSKRKAKFGSDAIEPNTSSDIPKQNAEANPPNTSKRKAKSGSEATELDTSSESPKQNAEINTPKTQGVRKSSRIQSKSKESIS